MKLDNVSTFEITQQAGNSSPREPIRGSTGRFKGPKEYQNYIRRAHGSALATYSVTALAGAATIGFCLSNPVGWGIGAGLVGLSLAAAPFHIWKLTLPEPRLNGHRAEAKNQLMDWFHKQGILAEGQVVAPVEFITLENEYRVRAEPQFRWMTGDTLMRIAQMLNSCHARQVNGYGVPDIGVQLGNILKRVQ